MKQLPAITAVNGQKVTANDFYEAGRERLRLKLVAGEKNLDRVIAETTTNRLGLALTGFFKCFERRRVQVVGNAEYAYIMSLSREERVKRIRDVYEHGGWLFIITNGHHVTPEGLGLAPGYKVVLLETPLKTSEFTRHAMFILERLAAPQTTLYGTMIEVCGIGVLFEGDPGLGKSETALGLIKRGSALVADDLTCVRKDIANNLLFGSASEATAGYMEIRGIGIMHVPSVFGVNALRGEKRLHLVITFKRLDEIRSEVDRIGQTRRMRTILGVDVPNIIIPVSEGRDLVNLVETAAQQQKLISAGYNPAAELSARLRSRAGEPGKNDKRKGRR